MAGLTSRLNLLTLGRQTVVQRPKLLLAAWLLHAVFAALAAGPAVRMITASVDHRPGFSTEVLNDFSLDLLTDWQGAQGYPLQRLFVSAAIVAIVYAVAKLMLDAALFPAYLHPFEEFRNGGLRRAAADALPGVIAASLMGLGASIVVLAAMMAIPNHWVVAAAALAAALLRVLTNLWKCASATRDASFTDAYRAICNRPGATLWLTVATFAGGAMLVMVSAATVWYGAGTAHVLWMWSMQQAVILAGVWLRLWLTASAVVLWRADRTSRMSYA